MSAGWCGCLTSCSDPLPPKKKLGTYSRRGCLAFGTSRDGCGKFHPNLDSNPELSAYSNSKRRGNRRNSSSPEVSLFVTGPEGKQSRAWVTRRLKKLNTEYKSQWDCYPFKGLSSPQQYLRIHFLLNKGVPGTHPASSKIGTGSPSQE